MKKLVILLFIIINILWAEENSTVENIPIINQEKLNKIQKDLERINNTLESSVWYTKYNNFQIYKELSSQIEEINKNLNKRRKRLSKEELEKLTTEKRTLENQLELLKDFKEQPFQELMKPESLPKPPVIDSPFSIVNGFSYMKILKDKKAHYENELEALREIIKNIEDKIYLLEDKYDIEKDKTILDAIKLAKKELADFRTGYQNSATTLEIYSKKIDDTILKVTTDIKNQMIVVLNIALFILAVIVLSFLFKYIAKKTISDNERYYMANKIINFVNFFIILVILLFSFIDNVTYLVTVLGFASAGIAIAMKDLFMSMLGWMVIVFGGSFHVGDRVKVTKDGLVYVGDIVDISLLRMTILEDITWTSYVVNTRSGRIVFIPNNYIFTSLISNYTHEKIKTVWDNINITITFDSNHQKALRKSKEIVKKYSKGYTDIARRQLNKIRNQYSLKITNVEPRVFTFIEEYGITISCWYMTNSYATLTLKSNISASLIDMINNEDDIHIAYPTQAINLNNVTKTKKEVDFEKSLF